MATTHNQIVNFIQDFVDDDVDVDRLAKEIETSGTPIGGILHCEIPSWYTLTGNPLPFRVALDGDDALEQERAAIVAGLDKITETDTLRWSDREDEWRMTVDEDQDIDELRAALPGWTIVWTGDADGNTADISLARR